MIHFIAIKLVNKGEDFFYFIQSFSDLIFMNVTFLQKPCLHY
jgi:hypothetical protein